jgi:serine protease Do
MSLRWPSLALALFALFDFDHSISFAESLARSAGRVDSVDVLKRANQSTVELIASTGSGRYVGHSNGAGVVISADGYIVTAYHVVRDFQKLEVRTSDGSLLPASLVVAEEDIDIALVKVTSSRPLEAASPAAAKRITEGRRAMVVGNPMGMGQSIIRGRLGTVRVVTWDGNKAPLRAIEADVVPGNSGGGAFDIETGELLGITVAKSSTMEGTGYMVPADQLGHLLRDSWPIISWIESREIHSTLGAMLRPVRLTEGAFENGLLVTHVDEASPADLAGWHVGDVLVGLDRYRTKGIDDVLYVLDQSSALDRSPLEFVLARDNARSVGVVDFGPTAGSPMLAQTSLLAPMR